MTSKRELDAMTADQLVRENQRLQREEDRIKEDKAKVKAAFDRAAAREAAAAILETLSDEQRAALHALNGSRKDATARTERAEVTSEAHDPQ